MLENPSHRHPLRLLFPVGDYICFSCALARAKDQIEVDCGATLIVSPGSILEQWRTEIAKHTHEGEHIVCAPVQFSTPVAFSLQGYYHVVKLTTHYHVVAVKMSVACLDCIFPITFLCPQAHT